MSHVSRRNFVGALSTLPMVPAAAVAQTSNPMALRHSANFTPEGVFYDLLGSDAVSSRPTIVTLIRGAGHTGLLLLCDPRRPPG